MRKRSVAISLLWLLQFLPTLTVEAQTTPPVGTWAQISNTAILPVMPPERELGNPKNVFAYSGGDLAQLNGVLGFVYWGGGHHDSADNSLYFAPLDGSGPRRLSGPFLIPPGGDYYPNDGLDHYTVVGRNQPGMTVGGAPKSRHTYSCLTTIQLNGRPQFFTVGGGIASLGGHGTNVARIFDLTQTYAQAMARPDMGWARQANAPFGTLTCSVGWDSKTSAIIVRTMNSWSAFNPRTNTWTRWGDSFGGSDYEASVAMDVDGRKMYVLGGGLAEVVDLDTHVVTAFGRWEGKSADDPNARATGPEWAKGFITPGWRGGYSKGPGVQWHPRRKRILAYVQRDATSGTQQDILQIDPVTGTMETLRMSGVTVKTTPGFSILGRFRLIPGTDTVVLAGSVDTPVYIGQLPSRGAVTQAPPAPPVSPPTGTPAPPPAVPTPAPLTGGQFLGPTGEDKVGTDGQLRGNGIPDWHIRLTGVASDPVAVQIDAAPAGRWVTPYNNVNYPLAKIFKDGTLDLWIEPYQTPTSFDVLLTYADGTSAKISGIKASGIKSAAAPTSPPPPTPPPPPTVRAPSPGTVWVKAGDPIPVRQWVERPGPDQRSPICNTSVIWNVEICNAFPPSKHTRMFYRAASKEMVIAGGDRPVAMPFPGYYDATGSEIVGLNVETNTFRIIRPFCVPGEPQPERPDNVGWAYDSRRDRAIMTPGFYFMTYGTGCASIHGWGAYVLDFKTEKFTGPDLAAGIPPPPVGGGGGTWGGDNGAAFSTYDPVNDELIRLRQGPRMERLNLTTKTWRLKEPLTSDVPRGRWNPNLVNAQPAIDVKGRMVYWLDTFTEYIPGQEGLKFTGQGHLAKTSLTDGSTTRIRLPAKTATSPGWVPMEGGDNYLVFDPINRIVLIPNSYDMGISPLSGLGIYHVDTGVWEWEAVPEAVAGSAWGFDENLGVLVGIGKRKFPTSYFLWKYGPKTP